METLQSSTDAFDENYPRPWNVGRNVTPILINSKKPMVDNLPIHDIS